MDVVSNQRLRWWWVVVMLATFVGSILRFAAIGQQSFWYDESFGDALVSQSSYEAIFSGRARDNGIPPLYYLTDKIMSENLGRDEASHRTGPALFGIATIPLIGLLGRRLCSPAVGAIAAWLLAISPFQIEISNEARVYSFLHFITTLDTLLFLRWLSSRSWVDGLVYSIGIAVACYSHYFIVFFILAQLIVILVQPDRWRLVGRWCVLMAVAAVLWLPWAPAFLSQLRTPGNLSRMASSWKTQIAATPVVFSVGRTFAWRDASHLLLGLAIVASAIGYCVPAAIGLTQRHQHSDRQIAFPLLLSWLLLPILIPILVAITISPVYHHRYASVALPAFLIAVAMGLVALRPPFRVICGIVIVAAAAYSLSNYYQRPIKDDWRSATRVVLSHYQPGQVICTDTDIEVLSLLYYCRRTGVVPEELYGLTDGNGFSAVRWERGHKTDPQPVDYANRFQISRSICLCLCVPSREPDEYQTIFERMGFHKVREESFYRVTVIWYERLPTK